MDYRYRSKPGVSQLRKRQSVASAKNMSIKSAIKALLPPQLLLVYRRVKLLALRRRNARLPVRDVFTRIYNSNEWGGMPGEFRSGSGSSKCHAILYADMVNRFVAKKGITRIVDLGCGDFMVGQHLLASGASYVGVDIVQPLIARNRSSFGRESVEFECLDIISDPIPEGDLCLLRQVLQHLSNAEITSVLGKTKKYRYIIVTEHYPAPSVLVIHNLDKPHGGDTRIFDNSAVYLDKPPFNAAISEMLLQVEARVDLVAQGEVIRSYLLENETSDGGPRDLAGASSEGIG